MASLPQFSIPFTTFFPFDPYSVTAPSDNLLNPDSVPDPSIVSVVPFQSPPTVYFSPCYGQEAPQSHPIPIDFPFCGDFILASPYYFRVSLILYCYREIYYFSHECVCVCDYISKGCMINYIQLIYFVKKKVTLRLFLKVIF